MFRGTQLITELLMLEICFLLKELRLEQTQMDFHSLPLGNHLLTTMTLLFVQVELWRRVSKLVLATLQNSMV